MSADSEKLSESFGDQLSDLESAASSGDVSFLNSAKSSLEELLAASGGDDTAVRDMLAQRLADGELRDETFELVTRMLDSYRSEQLDTQDDARGDDEHSATQAFQDVFPAAEDEFAQTMVINTLDMGANERADRNLQVGSVLRDRFLLKEQVAGGSMGVVFKALDRRLAESGEDDHYVAIKVLSPELSGDSRALRALQQEANKGRFLSHNHIVRFIDLDRDDDLYFIVMEWLEGENLADVLDRSVKLDVDRALEITRQVGEGLAYAHERGIVHADIKPANVMILENGNAKLFDFGIARVRQSQERSAAESDAVIPGAITPAYSSMQVLTGEEPVPEDDVFSLACLLYRLIAGYRVFGPRNAAEAAEAGMTPQPLPGLGEQQWKALKKALAFSRVARFDNVGAFLEELKGTASGSAGTSDAIKPSEPVEMVVTADRTGRFTTEPALDTPSRWPWVVAVLLIGGGAAAWFSGVLDPYLATVTPTIDTVEPAENIEDGIVDLPAEDAGEIVPVSGVRDVDSLPVDAADEAAAEPPVEIDSDVSPETEELVSPDEAGDSIEALQSLSESSDQLLQPATALPDGDLRILLDGSTTSLVLREDEPALVVDLVRAGDAQSALGVSVREAEFTGNQSLIESREILVEPTTLAFDNGVDRLQFSLGMTADPVREADQQVSLEVVTDDGLVLATINATLEDDDQRRFESTLPANTVAFASGQASVSEREAAVQVDVIRFRPDNQPLSIAFTVADVTATADEDYFPPSQGVVEFGPGQRSARILIPLVQDNIVEGNEAFVLELVSDQAVSATDLYQRVAIFIRDDDQ